MDKQANRTLSSTSDNPAAELSFVKVAKSGGRSSYWTVEPNRKSDYAADCASGKRRAEEFLRYLNDNWTEAGSGALLGWIVRDMPERHTGLEVGFFHRLSFACRDHPMIRLAADQTYPDWNGAEFERLYAAQTRQHRENVKRTA